MWITVIAMMLMIFPHRELAAQQEMNSLTERTLWFTLVGGFSDIPPIRGPQYITVTGSFTIQFPKHAFSLAHLTLGSDIDSGFGELGIEYGCSVRGKSIIYAVSAGPGAKKFGSGSPKISTTVG